VVVAPADSIVAARGGPVTPLPAAPPLEGPLWSVIVPSLVWLVTAAATYLLYRHFARKGPS